QGPDGEVFQHLVRLADGAQVVAPQIDAQGGQRLVLRPAVPRIDAVAAEGIERYTRSTFVNVFGRRASRLLLLLDVNDLLASHGARVTRAHLDAHLIAHRD